MEYDEATTSYENLVEFFYRLHDPTTKDRQGELESMRPACVAHIIVAGNDRGTQVRHPTFARDVLDNGACRSIARPSFTTHR